MSGVLLNVPYHQKDQAKALGARWNPTARSWYVPQESDLTPFARWLPTQSPSARALPSLLQPQEALTSAPLDDQESVSAPPAVTLSELLSRVSTILSGEFSQAVWIKAEIASLKKNRSGHLYLELIETDEDGEELARTRAMIWVTQAESILLDFENETSTQLQDGMAILCLAQVNFHVQYSFSLSIQTIDASYTQGQAQQKLIALRKQLKAEGLYALNRALPMPSDFTRVCVIAPQDAAGLGDFRVEADRLQAHGLCEFVYLHAAFQGASTIREMVEAIAGATLLHQQQPFDALVVIRGGGAKLDLNALNEYPISSALSKLPLPVLTGIGHEQDRGILDEIARQAFDTPSKVIGFITRIIQSNAQQAIEDHNLILKTIAHTLALKREQLMQLNAQTLHLAQTQFHLAAQRLSQERERVAHIARKHTTHARQQLQNHQQAVTHLSRQHLLQIQQTLPYLHAEIQQQARASIQAKQVDVVHLYEQVRMQAQQQVNSLQHQLKYYYAQVLGRDPHLILKQGYAIAKTTQGQPLTDASTAALQESFDLLFKDATLRVQPIKRSLQ